MLGPRHRSRKLRRLSRGQRIFNNGYKVRATDYNISKISWLAEDS
jgi:hypothetical protein